MTLTRHPTRRETMAQSKGLTPRAGQPERRVSRSRTVQRYRVLERQEASMSFSRLDSGVSLGGTMATREWCSQPAAWPHKNRHQHAAAPTRASFLRMSQGPCPILASSLGTQTYQAPTLISHAAREEPSCEHQQSPPSRGSQPASPTLIDPLSLPHRRKKDTTPCPHITPYLHKTSPSPQAETLAPRRARHPGVRAARYASVGRATMSWRRNEREDRPVR